jgi:hypothetical protein
MEMAGQLRQLYPLEKGPGYLCKDAVLLQRLYSVDERKQDDLMW